MGVYVFRCLHGPYVKVGHHLATRRRPHAYYRVAGRGFESVVHPQGLDGRLRVQDLVLEGWYPALTRQDETRVHRLFAEGHVGEFHRADDLPAILSTLDGMGSRAAVAETERARAIRWGYRQIKRAKRRRAAVA